jgi:hypothetical protein
MKFRFYFSWPIILFILLGTWGCDQSIVEFPGPPVVTIIEPFDNSAIPVNSMIIFKASAVDTQDGRLSQWIEWNTSVQNFIEIPNGPTFETDAFPIGTHTVTATVYDSDRMKGEDSITIIIY